MIIQARRSLRTRLAVAGAMAVLLLLALGYWWLDNLPHELFGTAMFVLLAWHVYTNRTWFKNLAKGHYGLRRALVVVFHLALILNMLILLASSLFISKALFRFLQLPDGPLVSEIHWFSAYWTIVAVGVHLGLHWSRLVGIARSAFNLPCAGQTTAWIGRALAVAAAGLGIISFPVLEVGTKLSFGYSVDFWDFEASVMPFFVRWAAVLLLVSVVTYHGDLVLARLSRRRKSVQG
ncbi:DUF4405 domain-containing protein [Rhizobium leguminosarum]|uniref:DUF4405 domain-containing protein n=1 Tax=Rhizobium leguminosarum TaxID=384 RepID=UPI0021BC1DAC|nr:DUF4405 domain-containing protein [Rhizobium leguminosarum]